MGTSVFSPVLCRLCGKEGEDTLDIFEPVGESSDPSPATLIRKCIPVKVKKTDRLPKRVCKTCLQELQHICEFIAQVLSTQAELSKIAGGNSKRSSGSNQSGNNEFSLEFSDLPLAPFVEVKVENDEEPETEPTRESRPQRVPQTSEQKSDENSKEPKPVEEVDDDDYDDDVASDNGIDDDDEFDEDEEDEDEDEDEEDSDEEFVEKSPKRRTRKRSKKDSEDESDSGSDVDSDYSPAKRFSFPRKPVFRTPGDGGPSVKRRGRPPGSKNRSKEEREKDGFRVPRQPRIKGEKEACDRCGKMVNPSYMKKHLLSHDLPAGAREPKIKNDGEKPVYMCHECGKVFAQKGNLDAHMRTHTGEKPFQCDLCPKAFSQKGNLDEHRRIHTLERPFCCEICGVRFSRQAQIKIHMRTHTGQRPYSCQFCPQSFKRLQTLRKHQRSHLDLRPYPCDMCDRRFRDRDKLIIHRRIHKGIRPYKCSVCQRGFYESGNLFKHAKVHQKDGSIGALDRSLVVLDDTCPDNVMDDYNMPPKYDCYMCATEFSEEKALIEHMLIHEKELKSRVKSDGRRGAKKGVRRKNEPPPHQVPPSVSSAPSPAPGPPPEVQHPAPPRIDVLPGSHFAAGALTPGGSDANNSQDQYGNMVDQFESGNTNSTIPDEAKIEPRSPDSQVGGASTPGASATPSSMPVFPPSLYPMWPFGGHA